MVASRVTIAGVQDVPLALAAALLPHYRVERELGVGGMATVYLARDVRHDRDVAIKVLKPDLSAIVGAERFIAEIRTTAHLRHPHILPLFDSGTADGLPFYVMPFVHGESLRARLRRLGRLPVQEAAGILREVADALAHAHESGIVHRDVKPDNVLFDEDGHALITDFGIATARFHGRLTGTGRAMGTPHYMSPEQAMGKMVDGRSDIYAVGVMLYEMLLGFPPFDGADSYSVGYKHVHETAAAPDVVDSRVSPELSALVMRCLSKPADARYQTGAELADALLSYLVSVGSPGETRAAWFSRRGGGASVTPA